MTTAAEDRSHGLGLDEAATKQVRHGLWILNRLRVNRTCAEPADGRYSMGMRRQRSASSRPA